MEALWATFITTTQRTGLFCTQHYFPLKKKKYGGFSLWGSLLLAERTRGSPTDRRRCFLGDTFYRRAQRFYTNTGRKFRGSIQPHVPRKHLFILDRRGHFQTKFQLNCNSNEHEFPQNHGGRGPTSTRKVSHLGFNNRARDEQKRKASKTRGRGLPGFTHSNIWAADEQMFAPKHEGSEDFPDHQRKRTLGVTLTKKQSRGAPFFRATKRWTTYLRRPPF